MGFGFGSRCGNRDLVELRRLSGIGLPRLQEALGMVKQYRLYGVLHQRRRYSESAGVSSTILLLLWEVGGLFYLVLIHGV